jgi:hypothetical protein
MSIARKVSSHIGARVYMPEGPFGAGGNYPLPSFARGEVFSGEAGAEYEYVHFPVSAAVTLNQGDCLIWDNTGTAVQSLTGAGAHPFGASMGFVFFGGAVGDLQTTSTPGNVWTYAFTTPGIYGLWAQKSGRGLINCATVNAQTKPINTTAVAGQLNAPSAALAGSLSPAVGTLAPCPTSWTFTGTTVNGSAVISNIAWTKGIGIQKGQNISGTGVPVGSVVVDFNGNTVTINNAATAAGSGVTLTTSNAQTYVNTTSGSAFLTGVTNIAGIYPNQTLTGTGIGAAGSATILAITGTAAPYTLQMSAPSTATASAISAVPSVYIEAFISWPTVAVQN